MKSPRNASYGRTQRAALTGVSSFLNYGGTLFVGLLITPIIVKLLGLDLYGIWIILGQLFGYISMVDICPTRVLKLTLATEQHSSDDGAKRRQVGAALVIAGLLIPLFLISGTIAARLFPFIIKMDPAVERAVQWAIVVMTLDAALRNFTSIPASVLRAMNLDYLAMSVNTCVIVMVGVLNVVVLWAGAGLAGLVINTFLGGFVSAGIRFYIVRRKVPWFGAARPFRSDVRLLLKRSAWFSFDSITMTLGQQSESLIIGSFLGTSVVAIYSLTRTLAKIAFEVMGQIFSSVNSGLADVAGRGDRTLLGLFYRRLLKAAVVMSMGLAGVIFLWNGPFVGLWVGNDKFGGHVVTALILTGISFKFLTGIHRGFAGSLLLIKQESLAASVKNIFVFALILFFTSRVGLVGALGAMAAGEMALLVYFYCLLRSHLPVCGSGYGRFMTAAAASGSLALVIHSVIGVRGWVQLGIYGLVSFIVLTGAASLLWFTADDWDFWRKRYGLLLRINSEIS